MDFWIILFSISIHFELRETTAHSQSVVVHINKKVFFLAVAWKNWTIYVVQKQFNSLKIISIWGNCSSGCGIVIQTLDMLELRDCCTSRKTTSVPSYGNGYFQCLHIWLSLHENFFSYSNWNWMVNHTEETCFLLQLLPSSRAWRQSLTCESNNFWTMKIFIICWYFPDFRANQRCFNRRKYLLLLLSKMQHGVVRPHKLEKKDSFIDILVLQRKCETGGV